MRSSKMLSSEINQNQHSLLNCFDEIVTVIKDKDRKSKIN